MRVYVYTHVYNPQLYHIDLFLKNLISFYKFARVSGRPGASKLKVGGAELGEGGRQTSGCVGSQGGRRGSPAIIHRIIAILWSSLAHESIDIGLVQNFR